MAQLHSPAAALIELPGKELRVIVSEKLVPL